MSISKRNRVLILLFITLLSIVSLFFIKPVSQHPGYHHFADTRNFLGLNNFWNVISNFPFLFIGCFGLLGIFKKNSRVFPTLYAALISSGIILTAFGSAYYHNAPSNSTLVWDRLPMTLVFMSFFSFLITARIEERAGKTLLIPLLLVGISSVLYWYFTELKGRGDLRFYGWVQFYPIIASVFILLSFPKKDSLSIRMVQAIVFYGAAKLCEKFDQEIYHTVKSMSGHSLKHLLASLSAAFILKAALEKENG